MGYLLVNILWSPDTGVFLTCPHLTRYQDVGLVLRYISSDTLDENVYFTQLSL
uniref:Uncharacterized protein n=1 Tax=Amphimedon queenslandica TaxID=400682 RepID=A0A1X7U384_AMPQE